MMPFPSSGPLSLKAHVTRCAVGRPLLAFEALPPPRPAPHPFGRMSCRHCPYISNPLQLRKSHNDKVLTKSVLLFPPAMAVTPKRSFADPTARVEPWFQEPDCLIIATSGRPGPRIHQTVLAMAARLLIALSLWHTCNQMHVEGQSANGGSSFGLLYEINPPIQDFNSVSLERESYSTWFDGCGQQACGCGIPPELLKDQNGKTVYHVALNVQNTAIDAAHLRRPVPAAQSGQMGLWENGKNCGRWVEITLLEDCLGLGLTPSSPPDVCGVNPFFENPLEQPRYQTDMLSHTKMYAVVADSCQGASAPASSPACMWYMLQV